MNKENVKYLKDLATRADYYYKIRKKEVQYIINNKISDKTLSVNIVLMAAVWASHQIDHEITEEDLFIFFGLNSEAENSSKSVLKLSSQHKELTLIELLELTVEQFR